jgi:thiol-disulfide isomerase/thioredoxin
VGGAGVWYVSRDAGSDGENTGITPVTLETVEAPGSAGDPVTVPARGRVSVVTFFATWCHVCEEEMGALGTAHESLDGVQFVSVTNEPVGHAVTREEIREWWVEHDGNWPVALDDDLELTDTLNVSGVPRVFVFDADNAVSWQGEGRVSAETIQGAVADARSETAATAAGE